MNDQLYAWNSEPSVIIEPGGLSAIAISTIRGIIVKSYLPSLIKVYDLEGTLIKILKIRESVWKLHFSSNDNYLIAICSHGTIVIKVTTWQCQVTYYYSQNVPQSKFHNRLPQYFRVGVGEVIQEQYLPKTKIIRKIKCTYDQMLDNRLSIYEQYLLIGGAQLSLLQIDSLKTLWYLDYRQQHKYATSLEINQFTNEFIYSYQDKVNYKHMHHIEIRSLNDGKFKKEILQTLTSTINDYLNITQIGEHIVTATKDGDVDVWHNEVKIRELKYGEGNQYIKLDDLIYHSTVLFSKDGKILIINSKKSFEIYKVQ